MKLVINAKHGGFSLSVEAIQELKSLGFAGSRVFWTDDVQSRADPRLVAVVEKLGSDRASGPHARLKVVEIPDGIQVTIEEYDGLESVAERHRTWY